MKNKLLELYKKHEEIVNYIIVGVMTTVFSWIVYAVSVWTFLDVENPVELQIANILSWIAGVAFAYVTNRKYVFKSTEKNILKEAVQFSTSRISTLLLDMIVMFVMVTLLGINDIISKFVSSVLVTISNYLISKLFVFHKKQ
ncbi:MAG: GtrA family protein [Lachnospiraceae bacterium]|nr:GtrA family protein [Lachnospiraceae bacterium]